MHFQVICAHAEFQIWNLTDDDLDLFMLVFGADLVGIDACFHFHALFSEPVDGY